MKEIGTCSRCGEQHHRYRNRLHTQFASYCQACSNERDRAERSYRSKPASDKTRAHAIARWAKRKGYLVKQSCENCHSERSEMHHDDYTKPLDVRWLCPVCHRTLHQKIDVNAIIETMLAIKYPVPV